MPIVGSRQAVFQWFDTVAALPSRKTKFQTYPGQSGSAVYRVIEDSDGNERYSIHGIHTFGDVSTQINRGVMINNEKIEWILKKEKEMIQRMNVHKQMKKAQKKEPKQTVSFLSKKHV